MTSRRWCLSSTQSARTHRARKMSEIYWSFIEFQAFVLRKGRKKERVEISNILNHCTHMNLMSNTKKEEGDRLGKKRSESTLADPYDLMRWYTTHKGVRCCSHWPSACAHCWTHQKRIEPTRRRRRQTDNSRSQIHRFTHAHFVWASFYWNKREGMGEFERISFVIIDARCVGGRWPCHDEIFEATCKCIRSNIILLLQCVWITI